MRVMSVIHVAIQFILFINTVSYSSQAVWPQFRGPGGLGIAPDTKAYPTELDLKRNLLWKTSLPEGHSSPCIWEDRMFITARSDEMLETICLDRRNGKIQWRQTVKPEEWEKIMNANSYTTPTPVCDGERVYIYSGSFGLAAYDLDGHEKWKKPLPIPGIQYGSGSSPIVVKNLVIINCEPKSKNDGYVLALNKDTGETAWECKHLSSLEASWSTPVIWKHGNQEELIITGSKSVTSYELSSGKQRWQLPGLPMRTTVTPLATDDTLYVAATGSIHSDPANPASAPDFNDVLEEHDANGDQKLTPDEIPEDLVLIDRLGPIFAVKRFFRSYDVDEDGALNAKDWKEAEAWLKKRWGGNRELDILMAIPAHHVGDATEQSVKWTVHEGVSSVASPLCYQNRIYLVKHGGIFTCLEAVSGNKIYTDKLGASGYYTSSPVAADNKIYICSWKGTVTIIQAGDTLNILSQTKLGERINATPALVDGKVYLRTAKHMMAFGG
ncbi:PQQ-binding-like beta-propeller repeat protein [Planctomycetota bacterium]